MVDQVVETEGLKDEIVKDLNDIGVCDLCTMRYLGVKDPYLYRTQESIDRIIGNPKPNFLSNVAEDVPPNADVDNEPTNCKMKKLNHCPACLGLLQQCIQDPCLDEITENIHKAGVQASSYAPMLSLPTCMLIRAYSIWFYLFDKFPQVYSSMIFLKPEGVGLKSVWKWICASDLKQKVDATSEWMTNGDLVVNMFLKYKDDDAECRPLLKMLKKDAKKGEFSRNAVEHLFLTMGPEKFRDCFDSPPAIPNDGLSLDRISCSHMAMFVAGRYCKYSRDVSQSPWLNSDGSRVRGEGSVQEFIVSQVSPIFNCDSIRFSASGREDSDVRMLGKGRPFVMEIVNPKRTIFTQDRIRKLQTQINESTSLISVRDLQIVDKKDLSVLKDGEETKNKLYTALCKIINGQVTPEMLKTLNETKMPLVLQQKTPLRVLHRRSLITRPRSILSMNAEAATKSPNMFILHVKTEAGTYVKEFVHGDFGRTEPSVTDLLNCPVEILALDVADVELDWPPAIDM